ncbi:MAG: hypothetical protein RH862_02020 [Leptospiraceae bacterium]
MPIRRTILLPVLLAFLSQCVTWINGAPEVNSDKNTGASPVVVIDLRSKDPDLAGVLVNDSAVLKRMSKTEEDFPELYLLGPYAFENSLMDQTLEAECAIQKARQLGSVLCMRITVEPNETGVGVGTLMFVSGMVSGLSIFVLPVYLEQPRIYHLEVFNEVRGWQAPRTQSYKVSKSILGSWLVLPFSWVGFLLPDDDDLWWGIISEGYRLDSSDSSRIDSR